VRLLKKVAMVPSDTAPIPPYQRIAGEIRQRITSGALRAGDPVPSTRQLVREFGIAMATATKVLATLRQEGLVRTLPGIGTVVDAPATHVPGPRGPRPPEPGLTRQRIVHTAIGIADAEGLAALSMRRTAAGLGVTTMALYRHVPGKDELLLLMADAVFGAVALPEPPRTGWRSQLEVAARMQWAMYRQHPWLAQIMSFTRPLLSPRAMAHGEWVMRALDGLGLEPVTMIHVHTTLASYVRGLAVNLETEAEAVQDSGITDEQWMDAHAAPATAATAFPLLASIPPHSLDLDTLFEFGLQRLLDGVCVLIRTDGGRR
jgi:DNA-binding transcriptional regulator YhcF (GntR family)